MISATLSTEPSSRKLPLSALCSIVNSVISMHSNSFSLLTTPSTRVCLAIRIAPVRSDSIGSGLCLVYYHSWLLALQVYPRGCRCTAICEFFDPISWRSTLTTSPETDCPVRFGCKEVEEIYARSRYDEPGPVLYLGSGKGAGGKLYKVRCSPSASE
jgi:hypothetical protein